MDEIILIGAGGHARSCIDVIETTKKYKIAGLVEKNNSNFKESLDYPIIGTDDDLKKIRKKYNCALVTIGQIKSPKKRIRLFSVLKDLNYRLPIIISPYAYVSEHSTIGEGTILMHNSIINANAIIGENCIINNKALIEHDVSVGSHCHISTGAIINGNVNVGNESFIGSGVITKETISIGSNCIIGAGKVLKKDINSNECIK